MEPGVLPVSHAHHDLLLHVLHHVLPGLGIVWRRGRDEVAEISRLNGGRDSAGLNLLQVLDYVVHHLPTSDLKLLRVHDRKIITSFVSDGIRGNEWRRALRTLLRRGRGVRRLRGREGNTFPAIIKSEMTFLWTWPHNFTIHVMIL